MTPSTSPSTITAEKTASPKPAVCHESSDMHWASYVEHAKIGQVRIVPGAAGSGKRAFLITMNNGLDYEDSKSKFLQSDIYSFCLQEDGLRKRMSEVPRG